VATDGTVTDGPNPDFISGITIVDVPSREEALKWAAKHARLPLRARGPGVHARPGRGELIGRRPIRLGERPLRLSA